MQLFQTMIKNVIDDNLNTSHIFVEIQQHRLQLSG